MSKFLKYILIFLVFLSFSSCLVVKEEEYEDVTPTITLSPKPEIESSDQLVRSFSGDMISFLPKDWYFVDLEDKVSSEIFAVGVNPDYTLSAVYSSIRKNSQIKKTVEKEGLLGLARLSMARRQRKTGGAASLYGKYTPINIGTNKFVTYEYTVSGSPLTAQVAVFISSLDNFYEFALIPMEFSGKQLPKQKEAKTIFRSVVTTIKF